MATMVPRKWSALHVIVDPTEEPVEVFFKSDLRAVGTAVLRDNQYD